MHESGALMRADSWEFPGAAGTQLLNTFSTAQEAPFIGLGCPPGPPAAKALVPPSGCPPAAANAGKPPLAPPQQASLSTNSTLTAAGAAQPRPTAPAADGSAPTQLLLPMRQISLDAITVADLACKAEPLPDRSSIFNDVIEQLAAKEESLPLQTGLYTLPSIQFLESLLEDMDSKTASTGHQPADPPLYLPLDAFDLPFEDPHHRLLGGSGMGASAGSARLPLGPSPFDLPPQPVAGAQRPPPHPQQHHRLQHGAALHHAHGGLIPTSNSMPILSHGHSGGFHGSSQVPHCRSAGPSPSKPVRRAASAYGAFDYQLDDAEMSLQMSKSGRVRKVSSFVGAKRKSSGELVGQGRSSLGEALPSAPSYHHHHNNTSTVSESDTGATTLDDESDDEVSKSSKASRKNGGGAQKKGGKRTTCLNCGCHQTPQWRCGPLGPRTLCNACGVRYKKGLPLNCWPIREGMVLPPGAVLPPGVHIPGVILQPAEDE